MQRFSGRVFYTLDREIFVKSGPLPKQIMPQALKSNISYTDIVVQLYRIAVAVFMNNLNEVSVEQKQTCFM